MKPCAYCKSEGKLTREHVIPDWYSAIEPTPDDITFSERAPSKFISELVIKDVCEICNNIHLSRLDAYGKELFLKYFYNYTFKDETISFSYDYDRLLKWLIKCSFNSARVNNTDIEVLNSYASFLISAEKLPTEVILFCSLIAPSNLTKVGDIELAERNASGEIFEPNWFRLGVFRIPNFDSINYCFRTVIINSFAFYISIPKIGSDFLSERHSLLLQLTRNSIFGVRIGPDNHKELPAPQYEAISTFAGHITNNPVTYELNNDSFISHMKKQKSDIVLFLIEREWIRNDNTKDIENFFLYITSCREIALEFMQKVEFSIHGYDDDIRELYQIPEVVRYIGKLNKIFPYWLFYQYSEGKWIHLVMACLSNPTLKRVEGKSAFIEMDTKLMSRHVNRWFISLNELCHKLSISERLNRQISKYFTDWLKTISFK